MADREAGAAPPKRRKKRPAGAPPKGTGTKGRGTKRKKKKKKGPPRTLFPTFGKLLGARAKKRPRRTDDLRGTLMLGFALLAILPMMVAVVAMTRIAERGIAISTDGIEAISKDALKETSVTIGDLSGAQIKRTGKQLSDIGSRAVQDTASALLNASEERFQQANQLLIKQGDETNQAVTQQLVQQSQGATKELARDLIQVSGDANRELAKQTASLAQTTIGSVATHLVDQANKNTSAISSHIVEQNQESAKSLTERLLKDIEKEPVVNFKTLASIFARGIATNKVAPIRDGYLAVVDARGAVLASTKYKKGTNLKHLAIVEDALAGSASEDSLLHFQDGKDDYLGVFAKRDGGGAVVFAYLADRARVDTDRMKDDVQATLNQMSSASSRYVVSQLESQRSLLEGQASDLAKKASSQLQETSEALSRKAAKQMLSHADDVSRRAMQRMTAESKRIAASNAERMRTRSQEIAANALAAMRPIGKQYTDKAEAAMRTEAERAVAETTKIVPRAAAIASRKATARMGPEAHRLADEAKRQMWLIAWILLGTEVLLAAIASLVMSGRIAAPIITERQRAREEQERMSREMEIASKIQTCLLPPVPELPDFDVAVSMTPAEEVGGDFVDLLPDEEPGAFWIGIGDVTGHGLTPGLIMMMAQSVFNSLARDPGMTTKRLYDGMNRVLYQNIKDRLKTSDHMTMSLLKHEANGTFVHCGSHLDILVYRAASGEVERIVTEGPWVGLLPECEDFTVETRFALGPDDVLLLYTDGLIEVQNPQQEQWDMDRLCQSLATHAHQDAHGIQKAVLADSLRWANKVLDDISMVVVKRTPARTETVRTVPQGEGALV